MAVLIPFHECSFKHREVAGLVKPKVKATATHPKLSREWGPWEGTARCGSFCWNVTQAPSQFYLPGPRALWITTVISRHLVWSGKSVPLSLLLNYSHLQPGQDFLDAGRFHASTEISFLSWRRQSACQRLPGVQAFKRDQVISPTPGLVALLQGGGTQGGFGLGWALVCL